MVLDQVPMLTRGPTALALGGEEIIKDLPKGSPGGVYTFTPHPKLQEKLVSTIKLVFAKQNVLKVFSNCNDKT